MPPLAIAIAIIAIPAVVLTFLRVNATIVFLSLCLGQVLVQFVGEEAARTVGIIASNGASNPQLVSLGLLVLPVVFTTLFMIGTIKGTLKLMLNFLPAVAVGVLALLLVEPLLTPGLRGAIESTVVWDTVKGLQALVIGVSAMVSIFILWLQRPKVYKEDKHAK